MFSARYFRMIIIFELFKLWPALDLEITLFTVNNSLKAAIPRLTYDESLIFPASRLPFLCPRLHTMQIMTKIKPTATCHRALYAPS